MLAVGLTYCGLLLNDQQLAYSSVFPNVTDYRNKFHEDVLTLELPSSKLFVRWQAYWRVR